MRALFSEANMGDLIELSERVRVYVMGYRSACLVLILFLILGIGTGIASSETPRPKNVQASLGAKWSGTPLLLEAGYASFLLFNFICFSLSTAFHSFAVSCYLKKTLAFSGTSSTFGSMLLPTINLIPQKLASSKFYITLVLF